MVRSGYIFVKTVSPCVENTHRVLPKSHIKYCKQCSELNPPFAVLVGGLVKNPCVRTVLRCNNQDTSIDLKLLVFSTSTLVSAYAREYLITLVDGSSHFGPALGAGSSSDSRSIATWGLLFKYGMKLERAERHPDFSGSTMPKPGSNLCLEARVVTKWINLVEHNLVLFVETIDHRMSGEEEQKNSGWW